ncbi:MAG: hypothetical protein VX824_04605, partial [Pseudomonadota bacterium]|nr:hypothetical protein [Pseudomonadota bacterium]
RRLQIVKGQEHGGVAESNGLLKRHSSKNSAFLYAVFGIRLAHNKSNNFVVSKSCKPAFRLGKN